MTPEQLLDAVLRPHVRRMARITDNLAGGDVLPPRGEAVIIHKGERYRITATIERLGGLYDKQELEETRDEAKKDKATPRSPPPPRPGAPPGAVAGSVHGVTAEDVSRLFRGLPRNSRHLLGVLLRIGESESVAALVAGGMPPNNNSKAYLTAAREVGLIDYRSAGKQRVWFVPPHLAEAVRAAIAEAAAI